MANSSSFWVSELPVRPHLNPHVEVVLICEPVGRYVPRLLRIADAYIEIVKELSNEFVDLDLIDYIKTSLSTL